MKTFDIPNRVLFALRVGDCRVRFDCLTLRTITTGSPIASRAVSPAGN